MTRVTSDTFLNGLKINRDYFFKQLKRIGVKNRHVLNSDDLSLISKSFPTCTYKSKQVFQRATDILGVKK